MYNCKFLYKTLFFTKEQTDLNVVSDTGGIKRRPNVSVRMNAKACKREYCALN